MQSLEVRFDCQSRSAQKGVLWNCCSDNAMRANEGSVNTDWCQFVFLVLVLDRWKWFYLDARVGKHTKENVKPQLRWNQLAPYTERIKLPTMDSFVLDYPVYLLLLSLKIVEKAMWWSAYFTIEYCILNANSTKNHSSRVVFAGWLRLFFIGWIKLHNL